jgi:hypothetical protein
MANTNEYVEVKPTGLNSPYYIEKGKDLWRVNPDGTIELAQSMGNADRAISLAAQLNAASAADRQLEFSMGMEMSKMDAAREIAINDYENAKRQADLNLKRQPELAKQSVDNVEWMLENVSSLQEKEFYDALDRVAPEWRESMNGVIAKAQGNVNEISERFRSEVLPEALETINKKAVYDMRQTLSRLDGETDPQIANQLKRHASQTYSRVLQRDQAAKGLQARDLGMTRNDLFNGGARGVGDTANAVLSNYASAFSVPSTATTAAQGNFSAQQLFMAPRENVAALWSNYNKALNGAGTISMDTALAASSQFSQMSGASLANSMGANLQLSNDISNSILAQSIAQRTASAQSAANQRSALGAAAGLGMIGLGMYGSGAFSSAGTPALLNNSPQAWAPPIPNL